MSQIKYNTVTVTNGSATVTGTGTTWLGNVSAGNYLVISDVNANSPVIYEVASDPASDTSLQLSSPWAGTSGTYNAVIHVDFSADGVPLLSDGDLETVLVFNRAMAILESTNSNLSRTATTDYAGLVEKATQAEMDAGTADKYPSAAEVKQHIDSRTTQSPTDTTAGRLLKVGDFGVGSTTPTAISSADSLTATGIYSTGSSWSGSVFPGSAGLNQGTLIHQQWSSPSYALQRFVNINNTWEVWVRRKDSGVWTSWRREFTSDNIVGTVSQLGGVPTGAIIESGSNVNGYYIKYANGTLFCAQSRIVSPSLAPGGSIGDTWVYPASFSNVVSCSAVGSYSTATVGDCRVLISIRTSSLDNTSLPFTATNLSNVTMSSIAYRLTAIGRWY